MAVKCAVSKCRSGYKARKSDYKRHDKCGTPENKSRVFRFPKKESLIVLWLKAIGRDRTFNGNHTGVCEKHFLPDDIMWNAAPRLDGKTTRSRLKPNAVPSVFENFEVAGAGPAGPPRTAKLAASDARRSRETQRLTALSDGLKARDSVYSMGGLRDKVLNERLPSGFRSETQVNSHDRSQANLAQGLGGGATAGAGGGGGGGSGSGVPDRGSTVYGTYSQSMMQGRGSSYAPVYMPEYPGKAAASAAAPAAGSKVPTHPDVVFKQLPFFDVIGELMKPTSLAPSPVPGKAFNDGTFGFHLTPQQADEIASNHDGRIGTKLEFPVQIQMRLCLLETSCPQEDHFPPSISVRVNNKACQLPNPIMSTKPGVDPRRPPKPVNITPLCRISPVQANTVHISWGVELGRAYCVSISIVRRLSSQDLLNRLRSRGAKNADFTRGLIKEKLCEGYEDEIATTTLKCSLQCPLGKCRMQLPCRATTCQHLQCFDASLYIQMNERKPTWVCPVCDKSALYSSLVIDGYFTEVLKKTGSSCMDVTLHQDGSWREVSKDVKEKPKEEEPAVKVHSLEDDSGSEEVKVTDEKEASPGKKKKEKEPTCVDLTLSDSDDDAPPPPKKRLAAAAAEGKWQSTPVGDTKIKLSFSGNKQPASTEVPTSGGGSSSLAALRSMSMSPGSSAGGAAPVAPAPFYQPVRPAGGSGGLPFMADSAWSSFMSPSVAPLSSWPAGGAPLPPQPPPSSSPDIISLD